MTTKCYNIIKEKPLDAASAAGRQKSNENQLYCRVHQEQHRQELRGYFSNQSGSFQVHP